MWKYFTYFLLIALDTTSSTTMNRIGESYFVTEGWGKARFSPIDYKVSLEYLIVKGFLYVDKISVYP